MSRQIVQPVNQVRLTNVAVVRLSRGGHRFEVGIIFLCAYIPCSSSQIVSFLYS